MKVGLVGIHYPRPEHRDEFIFRVRQAAEVLAATPGEDLGRAVGAPRREGGRLYLRAAAQRPARKAAAPFGRFAGLSSCASAV